jgi:hypothetical protein
MGAFFGYITNITYYLFFAAVANMLAPAGKYRKFVAVVTGFVLIVMVLAPLRQMGRDFDVADFFAQLAQGQGAQFDPEAYAHLHDSHLSAAFNEQLAVQLAHMLLREGIVLYEAEFRHEVDFTRITAIYATVGREEAARRVPFIRIEPVQVNRGRGESEEPDPLVMETKNIIADFYRVPSAHIHVRTKG